MSGVDLDGGTAAAGDKDIAADQDLFAGSHDVHPGAALSGTVDNGVTGDQGPLGALLESAGVLVEGNAAGIVVVKKVVAHDYVLDVGHVDPRPSFGPAVFIADIALDYTVGDNTVAAVLRVAVDMNAAAVVVVQDVIADDEIVPAVGVVDAMFISGTVAFVSLEDEVRGVVGENTPFAVAERGAVAHRYEFAVA